MKNKSRTPEKPPYTHSCPQSPSYQQQILQQLQAKGYFKISSYSKQVQAAQNSKQERVRVNINIIKNNIIKSVYELLKRDGFCQNFDIVVKFIFKEGEGCVSQVYGNMRVCQAVVVKYELLANLSKFPIDHIIECKIIGIKAKDMTLQKFLSLDRKTERNINLPLKQGQIHRNNTMQHRKKWAIAKYGTGKIDNKRKTSKNSDISGSSNEQIGEKSSQAKLQAQRQKQQEQKQRKSVQIKKSKRQLQLISGSQQSQQPAPIKQQSKKKEDDNLQKQEKLQENEKISEGKQVKEQKDNEIIQKQKGKEKSKPKKKSKSKSKSQNKSKGGNKKNSKNKKEEADRKQLIAIQEANLNEEVSNRKNKQIEDKQLRDSQEKDKKKSEGIIHKPFSFMNKKISLSSQDDAQKQQQVIQKQLNQELSSNHLAILSILQPQKQQSIGHKIENGNAQDSELSHRSKQMEQNSQQLKSSQQILKKILKQPIQQKTSHKNDYKDEAEQDRILQSLSISYDSSHHHRSHADLTNNSQVHRQLSNNSQVQGSTVVKSNQMRRGNTVESKKKKKNAKPQNNMTLDQFFKKKQK